VHVFPEGEEECEDGVCSYSLWDLLKTSGLLVLLTHTPSHTILCVVDVHIFACFSEYFFFEV
jgi:hypothetical protein